MGQARRVGDAVAGAKVKADVDVAKRSLGERGPVWWTDETPDWNRYFVKNTPYAEWFADLQMPPGTAT